MRLPFISRRAFNDLCLAHSLLRADLVKEQSARRVAEARAEALDRRLYEMQLATELHDQQLHAKGES
ncbi:hypothetical protein ACFVU3_00610 [Streptomyces sp. NPDC058052]|uniref:hypothetical protein n=1 Tax=Streptomyces sp. NPDC058052 TaxID=3346316 RepID=UPI0036E9B5B8